MSCYFQIFWGRTATCLLYTSILGIRPGSAVKYISGALGAAAAFIIFVPIHSVAVQLLYRLAVSVLLVGVAFPALNRKRLLRAIGVFYLVSIVFAGVTMLLIWLRPGLGFYTANGVVYYNIPPLMLLACVAAVSYTHLDVYKRQVYGSPEDIVLSCTAHDGKR